MDLSFISQPVWFLAATLVLFIIIVGRYFLIAGIFYSVFYKIWPQKFTSRRLNKNQYLRSQFRTELKWSMVTASIFSIFGSIVLLCWDLGINKVYIDVDAYGIWYLPVSLLILMFLHETYYYWAHRCMHHPKIFRYVHKVHHDSHITSPFTAFSFHPLEALIQAIFLPVILLILPMHFGVLLVQLALMTLTSVINHLNIEIYPKNFHKHFFGRWLIGATHHALHHKQYRYNYGLYFTIWDKVKKTESPNYEKMFEEATNNKKKG